MTKTTFTLNAISLGAALLALAAAVPAGATQPAEARISVADLNLSNASDAVRFEQRIDDVATHMCRNAPNRPLLDRAACRAAVREEAVAQLGGAQQRSLQLAMNRTGHAGDRQTAGF